MKKLSKYIYFIILSFTVIFTACEEPGNEITNIDYDRLFSPTNLEARVLNKVDVRLRWQHVLGATQYEIQFFDNGDLNFSGTPALTTTFKDENAAKNSQKDPLILETMIKGLQGETDYSIRIKAMGDIAESKWISTTASTEKEQIFLPVDPDEIQATQVILRWPAGQAATGIVLNPGNISHSVTASEVAAGAATITGLTGETNYTAVLMNGTKERGRVTFTTLIDLGGATAVNPDDDLVAILNAAKDGDAFVIFPGNYTIGTYALTKSVKLTGYKTNDKPVLFGQFSCGASVASVELKSLIVRGDVDGAAPLGQFFDITAGCNLASLSVTDCEIFNYANNFIYNNSNGVVGNILISGCYVRNIDGSGGDGIDFRNGAGSSLGSLKVEKTTFANGFRAFLRMQNPTNASFQYCTFYKVSTMDNSNNTGLFRCSGGGDLEVSNCLFVETGPTTNPIANTGSGNWCRNAANMTANTAYAKNFYYNCFNLWVGLYTDPATCGAKETNPQFTDPAGGNFKINNLDLIGVAGDPRWW